MEVDSYIGSQEYTRELAEEVLEAWKCGSYRYVFSTLNSSPFSLTLVVYSMMDIEEDRKKFEDKAIHYCRGRWSDI